MLFGDLNDLQKITQDPPQILSSPVFNYVIYAKAELCKVQSVIAFFHISLELCKAHVLTTLNISLGLCSPLSSRPPGIVSLVSMSILSYERYTTLLCPTKADLSDFRKAWLWVAGSWLYSLMWTLPPLLGWSHYGPEGPGTSCSVEWRRRSVGGMSYVVCLFVFCLALPLLLMLLCYIRILQFIREVSVDGCGRVRSPLGSVWLHATPWRASSPAAHSCWSSDAHQHSTSYHYA